MDTLQGIDCLPHFREFPNETLLNTLWYGYFPKETLLTTLWFGYFPKETLLTFFETLEREEIAYNTHLTNLVKEIKHNKASFLIKVKSNN